MQLKRLAAAGAVVLGFSAVVAGTASAAAAPQAALNINGSSLVQPLAQTRYDAWAYLENASSTVVGAQGSSTGISDICNGSGTTLSPTTDLGDSDAPLGVDDAGSTATTLVTNCPSDVYQVPWAATGTGVAYHIPGVGKNLHLDGPVIYKIISGQIKNWDNSSIQALNKKSEKKWTGKYKKVKGKKKKVYKTVKVDSPKLPNVAITLIYRNGSGDTYAFENYLKHDSAGVPSDDAVSVNFWTPVPTTAIADTGGNTGMLNDISDTPGAFGYIAVPVYIQALYSGSATTSGVNFAELKNAAGNYEPPNFPNIKSAVDAKTSLPAQGTSFGLSVVDPAKKYKTAYPLATYTYAMVARSSANATEVKSFLDYSVSSSFDGTTGGAGLDQAYYYVPIPASIQTADKSLISKITTAP